MKVFDCREGGGQMIRHPLYQCLWRYGPGNRDVFAVGALEAHWTVKGRSHVRCALLRCADKNAFCVFNNTTQHSKAQPSNAQRSNAQRMCERPLIFDQEARRIKEHNRRRPQ